MSKREILLIDNLDSFSFNLVESFQRLGCTGQTLRHSVAASDALAIAQERKAVIVLSPGPGKPEDAGCCMELISLAKGKVPLLGICLGHQAIVKEAGGTVCRAPEPVHGKTTAIDHDGRGAFEGLPNPLRVGRYHSLCTRNLPNRFIVHAHIEGMAMGISDPDAMQTGIQFHPESILTTHGDRLLANVLDQAFAPA
jgi:anthranilate synthase/aminodeoxychorismate synthase-like glutamine amidotransferase